MGGAAEVLTLTGLAQWAEQTGNDLGALDFTPAWKQCNIILEVETKRNFDEQHAPDGTPWKPLASNRNLAKYSASHRRRILHERLHSADNRDRPLRDTGMLMGSVTSNSSQSAIREMEPQEFTFGSNLEYAGIQNYGGTIIMPAREQVATFYKGKFTKSTTKRKGTYAKKIRIGEHKIVIPARPFVGINEAIADKANEIVGDFVGSRL